MNRIWLILSLTCSIVLAKEPGEPSTTMEDVWEFLTDWPSWKTVLVIFIFGLLVVAGGIFKIYWTMRNASDSDQENFSDENSSLMQRAGINAILGPAEAQRLGNTLAAAAAAVEGGDEYYRRVSTRVQQNPTWKHYTTPLVDFALRLWRPNPRNEGGNVDAEDVEEPGPSHRFSQLSTRSQDQRILYSQLRQQDLFEESTTSEQQSPDHAAEPEEAHGAVRLEPEGRAQVAVERHQEESSEKVDVQDKPQQPHGQDATEPEQVCVPEQEEIAVQPDSKESSEQIDVQGIDKSELIGAQKGVEPEQTMKQDAAKTEQVHGQDVAEPEVSVPVAAEAEKVDTQVAAKDEEIHDQQETVKPEQEKVAQAVVQEQDVGEAENVDSAQPATEAGELVREDRAERPQEHGHQKEEAPGRAEVSHEQQDPASSERQTSVRSRLSGSKSFPSSYTDRSDDMKP